MKKTRKLFAGLTALTCLTGLTAALPVTVQAETIPWTCRVSLINYDEENQPESYIVTENRFFNYSISAEEMKTYLAEGSTLPVVGDVLYIMSPARNNGNSLGEFVFEEDSTITNQGNELEFFTDTKEYVVTKHSEDTGGVYWTRLTDAETGNYWIYKDYDYLYDSVYSLKDVSIGDIVTCAVNTSDAYSYPMQVLSIEKGDGTVPDLTTPDSEYGVNIIFMGEDNPQGQTNPSVYAVNTGEKWSEWALSGFTYVFGAIDSDELPQYGDVYTGMYMIYETYPGQFEPSYLKKCGTVEDFYPIKEMTVSLNHPYQGGSYPEMILTDADGKDYRYCYDMYNYVNWKFDTPIQNLKAGDTVRCAMTENGVLMITDIVNTSASTEKVEEDDTVTIIMLGTKGEAYQFNKQYFMPADVSTKYMQGITAEYGDVFKIPEKLLNYNYNPEKEPENTKIEKLGTAAEYYGTVKELTVKSNENWTIKAEDADGTVYTGIYQSADYTGYDAPVYMDDLKAGETYEFVLDGTEIMLVLPDEKNITVNPVTIIPATGDADGNGKLDILDIITVNKVVMGKETLDPDRIFYIDFNQNGSADADDSLIMIKKLVGLA